MTTTKRVVQRFRVAQRYKLAAMDDAKMEALLQKIRKGATSSLTWSQLGEVFQTLGNGWRLEKTTDFIPLFDERPANYWVSDNESGIKKHQEYKDAFVSSLPTTAKPGKLYVTELSELKASHRDALEFQFKGYWGNDAWRIVTPNGQERIERPSKFDVGDGSLSPKSYRTIKHGKIRLYDVIPWLKKETSFMEDINAKLGTDPHETGVVRTRDGTGTCPACFQNIKLANGEKMVLHGYRRPGTGTTHGKCFCVGYPAFELSVKGSKDYLEVLQEEFDEKEHFLKRLKDGSVDSLPDQYNPQKFVKKGEPTWERQLERKILLLEDELAFDEGMINAFKRLIQNWKPRPLPKEGDRKIDLFSVGQKP